MSLTRGLREVKFTRPSPTPPCVLKMCIDEFGTPAKPLCEIGAGFVEGDMNWLERSGFRGSSFILRIRILRLLCVLSCKRKSGLCATIEVDLASYFVSGRTMED